MLTIFGHRDRPMAHATCSKKRQESTSLRSSPTREEGNQKGLWRRLEDKWNRARPYVERLNGTAVPLRNQSIDRRMS